MCKFSFFKSKYGKSTREKKFEKPRQDICGNVENELVMKETIIIIEREKEFDELWEKHKKNVQRDDEGEYLLLDNHIMNDAGMLLEDFKAPGNFQGMPGKSRYSMRPFRGKFRLSRTF